jgi:hypothetical protein
MSAELFNALLKESLNETNIVVNSNESIDTYETNINNKCLITGDELSDKYITLECQHSFNYIPLMNEVLQWKRNYKNKNYCYKNKISLNNQLVCPYCRTVTRGILPWFDTVEGETIPKTKWVNWPKSAWYFKNKCLYRFSSGKKKGECCGKGAFELFCSQHEKYKDRYDDKGNPIIKEKKHINKPIYSCMHMLSRGKRKGMLCGKKAIARKQESTGYILYHCSSHYKYYL